MPSGQELRTAFGHSLTCILIRGEGGTGKTSLACQIARWATASEPELRPTRHLMLPVLLDRNLEPDAAPGKDPFVTEIRGKLQVLIDEREPVPEELVERLLRHRRVLVIVDRLSELSKATRDRVRPGSPEFPANALIVTSRLDETTQALSGVTATVMTPLRFAADRLASFMEAYLLRLQKRQLFDDQAFFEGCRGLSAIVGAREITVLLAKLYADQMVKHAEGAGDRSSLPDSIPRLMLDYLNLVNEEVEKPERLESAAVHRDLMAVAWECLRRGYRPDWAGIDQVLSAIGGDDAKGRLAYLTQRLRLVEIEPTEHTAVKIVLDPLAEYLAGHHLVRAYREDADAWRAFLAQGDAQEGAPGSIAGFLLAVRDCCLARPDRIETPAFMAREIARRVDVEGTVDVEPVSPLAIVVLRAARTGPIFNVGCTLRNGRKDPVTIYQLEARLSDPQGATFPLRWERFYDGGMLMREISVAQPIELPPTDGEWLGIQFVGPGSIREYAWPDGRYDLDVWGWLSPEARARRPDVTTRCEIEVSVSDAGQLRFWTVATDDVWDSVDDPDNAVAVPVPLTVRPATV